MTFQKGHTCKITGLQQREDLNGALVTLVRWSKKHARWEARCSQGEYIRIRPQNLTTISRKQGTGKEDAEPKPSRYVLEPCLGIVLKDMVRGGGMAVPREVQPMVGSGQITSMTFDSFAEIASEVYTDPPPGNIGETKSSMVMAMLLDFIGKDGDSGLVLQKLKTAVANVFAPQNLGGIVLPTPSPLSTLLKTETTADLGKLMYNLRMGTIAFIEKHQGMLANVVSNMKGCKMKSNRHEAATVMKMILCGKDDNKSIKCANLEEELKYAASYGEVTVIGKSKLKKVEVNEFLHRAYVEWLLRDVLPTMTREDARKGSLGEWHRIASWEKQLTASINATPARIILDVSDDFDIAPWIDEGLLSLDLSVLSDAPGVDTDRRILRLAFFAELAWQYSLDSGAWDKKRQAAAVATDSSSRNEAASTSVAAVLADVDEANDEFQLVKADQRAFKKKSKVIIVDLKEREHSQGLCNGMEGRVLGGVDDDSKPDYYRVSFTNLADPQTLHVRNLQRVAKVSRELHNCHVCGASTELLCSRCSATWYCGEECQKADRPLHKAACKAMAAKNPFDVISDKMEKTSMQDAE